MPNVTRHTAAAALLAVELALAVLVLQARVANTQGDHRGSGGGAPALYVAAEATELEDLAPCGGVSWAVCRSSGTQDDPPPPPDPPA
jgi:hypothetical protein